MSEPRAFLASRIFALCPVFLLGFAVSTAVAGATANSQGAQPLLVPAQYRAIQVAIDATVDGDTIQVAPGTYAESIDFLGKDITVISELGPDVTTLDPSASVVYQGDGEPIPQQHFTTRRFDDGRVELLRADGALWVDSKGAVRSTAHWPEGADPVVTFANGESRDAVLEGFTITGGNSFEGGGIRIHLEPFWVSLTAPNGPDGFVSTSHTPTVASLALTIDLTWNAATDGASGVAGYHWLATSLSLLIIALVAVVIWIARRHGGRMIEMDLEGIPELRQEGRPLEPDLAEWVQEDFTIAQQAEAIALLEQSRLGDREQRCALFLAKGSVDGLTRAIDLGNSDYRDLIVAAEYEQPGFRQVRDFTKARPSNPRRP